MKLILLCFCAILMLTGCQSPKKPIAQVDNTRRTSINDEDESEFIWRLAGYAEYEEVIARHERAAQIKLDEENRRAQELADAERLTPSETQRIKARMRRERLIAVEQWERSKLPSVVVGYFNRGSSRFSLSIEEKMHVEKLLDRSMRVDIRGRTDGSGVGTENDKLALKRALSAKRYLLELGVSESIISLNFSAENNYVSDDGKSLEESKNRRVEIEFILKPVTETVTEIIRNQQS